MIYLRAFLAMWLVLQVVLPLLPAWGVFLPHEHFARGRVSAREWQAHGEYHRNPRAQSAGSSQAQIFSVPMNDGLVSVWGDSTAIVGENLGSCAIARKLVGRVAVQNFFGYTIAFPPRVPPPTT